MQRLCCGRRLLTDVLAAVRRLKLRWQTMSSFMFQRSQRPKREKERKLISHVPQCTAGGQMGPTGPVQFSDPADTFIFFFPFFFLKWRHLVLRYVEKLQVGETRYQFPSFIFILLIFHLCCHSAI